MSVISGAHVTGSCLPMVGQESQTPWPVSVGSTLCTCTPGDSAHTPRPRMNLNSWSIAVGLTLVANITVASCIHAGIQLAFRRIPTTSFWRPHRPLPGLPCATRLPGSRRLCLPTYSAGSRPRLCYNRCNGPTVAGLELVYTWRGCTRLLLPTSAARDPPVP